jgi:hypothetical protein
LIGSCLSLDKSIVPEPDQLPTNSANGLAVAAEPTVTLLCAVALQAQNKIAKAKVTP